jgi:hypothetical protein
MENGSKALNNIIIDDKIFIIIDRNLAELYVSIN